MSGRLSSHLITQLLLAVALAIPLAVFAAPAKMKAIVVQSGSTGTAALQIRSIDTPKPGPNQLLIQVYAAEMNPVDWKRATAGSVPGFDAAGIVEAVGPGVTTFKPGDAVVARAEGAYAQFVVASLDSVVLKPRTFTFEQAAGIPVAGIA